MRPILSPYLLIMIAAAIICMFIAVYVWLYRRKNSETIPLILLLSGIAEWIIASLMGLVDQDLAHKILWAKIEYIGVVSVPLAVLGYVLHHSGSKQQLNIKRLAWLAVIPVATLVLAWTNGNHGLIWARYIPYQENGLVLSEKTYGPGFWVYWVYSYLVLLAATIITFRLTLVSARIFRWQSTLVMIGILVPWVGNLLYVLHITPFKNMDLTPLGFSITGILLATGLFRWRLFDIKPIAQAAVIAGMVDGLMILDNQGRIVEVNPATQDILGLGVQELVGKKMEQVLVNLLPSSERSDRMNKQSILIKPKRGRENRDYELSDSPFYEQHGTPGGRIIFLHDVTDRKYLEERLRETERKHAEVLLQQSENKYETLYQNMSVGVFYQSVDGKVTDANPAAERILGVELAQISDLVSMRANLQTVHEDGSDYPAEEHPSMVTLKTSMPLRNQVMGVYFPNEKNQHWININTVPQFKPGDEKPYQVVVTFDDMTELRQADLEVRRLNAELEQRVIQRTAQLEAANKELEAFSYSVSHDLRAPLRGIDGWSLALLEDFGSQLDGRAKNYLERVRSETQRMGRLIDDLLQLSRLASAEMSVNQVDLSAMAGKIAARLQEAQPDRQVELVIEPGMNANGDSRLLDIALTNLLGNAVKFTGKTPQPRIQFGQTEVEGQRAFFVRDNGVGFDMALAKKLFGAFQRLHKASDFPGTGVGLTNVQRIVHRHGGRIWAEAAVDQGATFYFTIEEIR